MPSLRGISLKKVSAKSKNAYLIYYFIVLFRFCGKNYNSAIISAGHCGFGLGAVPVSMATITPKSHFLLHLCYHHSISKISQNLCFRNKRYIYVFVVDDIINGVIEYFI